MAKAVSRYRDLTNFFGISAGLTLVAFLGIVFGQGFAAAATMLVLIAIEITFSFENAIINARVLEKLSPFWQRMFLTLGIVIAIFGMRIIFPVLIVSITAGLSWTEVINLVLNHPVEYAHHLGAAHPAIAAFGGAFLLMLALHFFFDETRTIHWIPKIERSLQQLERNYLPIAISLAAVLAISFVPGNKDASEVRIAGALGIVTYVAIHLFTMLFEKMHERTVKTNGGAAKHTGVAALSTFLYLEVLDASFSFDGVIGAFAVTSSVLLIAVGLGVGAIWVRSLTVFMVRRGTLDKYKYLEHGAHYTVFVLAATLLLSIVIPLPEAVAGVAGVLFIGGSYWSSRQAFKR